MLAKKKQPWVPSSGLLNLKGFSRAGSRFLACHPSCLMAAMPPLKSCRALTHRTNRTKGRIRGYFRERHSAVLGDGSSNKDEQIIKIVYVTCIYFSNLPHVRPPYLGNDTKTSYVHMAVSKPCTPSAHTK